MVIFRFISFHLHVFLLVNAVPMESPARFIYDEPWIPKIVFLFIVVLFLLFFVQMLITIAYTLLHAHSISIYNTIRNGNSLQHSLLFLIIFFTLQKNLHVKTNDFLSTSNWNCCFSQSLGLWFLVYLLVLSECINVLLPKLFQIWFHFLGCLWIDLIRKLVGEKNLSQFFDKKYFSVTVSIVDSSWKWRRMFGNVHIYRYEKSRKLDVRFFRK